MALVKVCVRITQEIVKPHYVEIADGLTDEEVEEAVQDAIDDEGVDDSPDEAEKFHSDIEILFDTIERVGEGDEQP